MQSIDPKNYQNEIKLANRSEYDKYIVTVFNSKTNEVFASFVEAINFDLEEKLKDTLVEVMNQSFPNEDGKEYSYIEYTHSVILNLLEDEQNSDSYLEQVMVKMPKFRMKLNNKPNWVYPDSVKDVVVGFNKINGYDDYHSALNAFKDREAELLNKFDSDFQKATGLNVSLYKYLTKSISKEDREYYMMKAIEKVVEYLKVLEETEVD